MMKVFRELLLMSVVLFVAILIFARGAETAPSADVEGIEKLHLEDIDATLSHDPKALADLFTEDAVLLEPGSAAVIGKKAIFSEDEREQAEHPTARILKYHHDIKDLKVFGGMAVEWGDFEVSFKDSDKGEVKNLHGKSLRVLRREPDGNWKFARVMWNQAE